MMHFVVAEPFDAGVTFADDMVFIGLEGNYSVALHGRGEAAGGLADATKRVLGTRRHVRKGARRPFGLQARGDALPNCC